jgi:uncharacterized protein YcfJ
MKRWIASLIAVLTLNSASAQLFSPESFQGAWVGALIGGVVGGDRHHGFSGEGAAIGAGVGLVTGALIGESHRQRYYNAPYAYPAAPGYGYAPVYTYAPSRPNYAVGGTLIGAASGALIGEGTSGRPGRGAAIGAAAGLVLGSVAEHEARNREMAPVNRTYAAPVTTPSRVTRVSPWTSSPAPRYQIPDAPRVPDAPTF